MRSSLPLAIVVLTSLLLGAPCGTQVVVLSPTGIVDEFTFEVEFEIIGDIAPGSLQVEINQVSILDRVTGGPQHFTAVIEPGSPLRDDNVLQIRADRPDNGKLVKTRSFKYLPPGKARARRIEDPEDLIRGPLGHSRIGDYLLENGTARFAIQDAGQRELYSVGTYGGNLIDAELVGRPGKDNFLEVQAGLNIETVINAQSVEIVNDGQDGTPAVIRTCGPDDLLDFVNPSSQVVDLGLPFPPLANDRDLEIEGCTSYSLAPLKDFVRVDTEVFNNEPSPGSVPDPLPLFVGDWLNPSGELDTFTRAPGANTAFTPSATGVGSPVASFVGSLGFYGYDEAGGVDYAFTQIPLPPPNSNTGSFVAVSGVLVVLHSQNVLLTLIWADSVRFKVASGASNTFTRFFGVGDGSPSNAVDLENEVRAVATGTVQGCVSVSGGPVAGARVSVGTNLFANTQKLASHFTTRPGPCPNYSGTVPPGASP